MIYAGVAIAWLLSLGGAFWYGTGVGEDSVLAFNAKSADIVAETRRVTNEAVSDGIAKIQVKNTTINRKLETQVRTEKVFTDCRSGPSAVELFNQGIPGAEVKK